MCDVLSDVITEFLALRSPLQIGEFESDAHAWSLSNLPIRDVEAGST